ALDTPLRLADAVRFAFPHGGMTVAGLRKEAGRGRLTVWRIAGKDFTSLAAIEGMKEACRVVANRQGCGSGQPQKTADPFGSSSTAESRLALAAARAMTKELRAL